MTSPNFNNPSQVNGLADAANKMGIGGLQSGNQQGFMLGRLDAIGGPFGSILGFAMGGLGSIVDDILGFATDGAQNNTMDAAAFVRSRIMPWQADLGWTQESLQDRIDGIVGDVTAVMSDLNDVWDYYEGLSGGVREIQNGINQGWIDGDESEADPDVFATMRGIRTAINGNPWVRVVALSSQTWNRPDPLEFDLKEVVLIMVSGGTNGEDGKTTGSVTDAGNDGGHHDAVHVEGLEIKHLHDPVPRSGFRLDQRESEQHASNKVGDKTHHGRITLMR